MIVQTLFLQPLGPALVMALGGLAMTLSRRLARRPLLNTRGLAFATAAPGYSPSRLPRLSLLLALLISITAAGAWYLLRFPPARSVLLWAWQPLTVAGSVLEWRSGGWNWLAQGLILLLTATTLLLRAIDPERSQAGEAHHMRLDRLGLDAERTLWLAAAALVFVCSTNVITLAGSWVLLDAALALRLRPGLRAEPAARAWVSLSLGGVLLLCALVLLGEGGIRTPLTGQFSGATLALLWLAGLVRAGVYPLHFWLTGGRDLARADRIVLGALTPLTGLWLLARLHAVAGSEWLRRPEWVALGALALLGTAVVAWAAETAEQRWRWIALNRASLVLLAAYATQSAGPEALASPVVAFALGCALLAAGEAAREVQGWRAPLWLAALVVWGLPGTPGFLARAALVFPTDLTLAVPLFGIVLIAEILLAAALWQAAMGEQTSLAAPPRRRVRVALLFLVALLGLPALLWGIAPRLTAGWIGWSAGDLFPSFGVVLGTARRSVWIGLALSAVGGVGLGLARRSLLATMRGWQSGIAAVASLEWLYRAVGLVFGLAASGIQYFSHLGEGEGYLGWLALAGLILWVLFRG